MLGHAILHDPEAVVGHRYPTTMDNYEAPFERLLVNQLRITRKSFTHGVWRDWVDRCRRRNAARQSEHPEGHWAHAWLLFHEQLASADAGRALVQGRRVRDEFRYAERFDLPWPRLRPLQLSPRSVRLEPETAGQRAQASPGSPIAPDMAPPDGKAVKTKDETNAEPAKFASP